MFSPVILLSVSLLLLSITESSIKTNVNSQTGGLTLQSNRRIRRGKDSSQSPLIRGKRVLAPKKQKKENATKKMIKDFAKAKLSEWWQGKVEKHKRRFAEKKLNYQDRYRRIHTWYKKIKKNMTPFALWRVLIMGEKFGEVSDKVKRKSMSSALRGRGENNMTYTYFETSSDILRKRNDKEEQEYQEWLEKDGGGKITTTEAGPTTKKSHLPKEERKREKEPTEPPVTVPFFSRKTTKKHLVPMPHIPGVIKL